MLQKYLSRVCPGIFSSIVVIAILWLTLAPHPLPESDVPLFEHADKVVHALMFGGLVFALIIDRELLRQRRYEQTGALPRGSNLPALILIAVGVSLFGGGIELLQAWMGLGRGCDLLDFLADTGGAFLSAVVSPSLASLLLHRR